MATRKQLTVSGLQKARRELLSIRQEDVSYPRLMQALNNHTAAFKLYGGQLAQNLPRSLSAHQSHGDVEALNEVRAEIIQRLDYALNSLETDDVILPVLDRLILQVKDTKLSTLLKEFNAAKDQQPNIAAIGYRTILALIIQERAKLVDPTGPIATKQDLALDRDIKAAIEAKLFDEVGTKLLKRFLGGLNKDTFDIVAHKTGNNALVEKENLSGAVDLLNRLLPQLSA
jgi:hypothetical protein